MTRKEFLKVCTLLGIGLPFQQSLSFAEQKESRSLKREIKKVIVVGAGPAGLSAAYLLNQKRVEVQVLEASSVYGGRTKRVLDFADFPIPLGAEWLHVKEDIFNEIVNDPSVPASVNMIPYDRKKDYALYRGKKVSLKSVGFKTDRKFLNSSWFDFFEKYIIPSVKDKIIFDKVVKSIDYSGEKVRIQTEKEKHSADKVIVTIPVKVLQSGALIFTPALPEKKAEAIRDINVWDGCKAFIEFSEKFYPAAVSFKITPRSAGQKLYYDAAYGQNTRKHILGLFAVGTGTRPYVELPDKELISYILNELDELFEGKASKGYIKHIFQNWNKEPFAQGAYITDYENWKRVRTLGESVNNKLFFAGDAYTDGEDWSSVHAAARSAKRVVNEILG